MQGDEQSGQRTGHLEKQADHEEHRHTADDISMILDDKLLREDRWRFRRRPTLDGHRSAGNRLFRLQKVEMSLNGSNGKRNANQNKYPRMEKAHRIRCCRQYGFHTFPFLPSTSMFSLKFRPRLLRQHRHIHTHSLSPSLSLEVTTTL